MARVLFVGEKALVDVVEVGVVAAGGEPGVPAAGDEGVGDFGGQFVLQANPCGEAVGPGVEGLEGGGGGDGKEGGASAAYGAAGADDGGGAVDAVDVVCVVAVRGGVREDARLADAAKVPDTLVGIGPGGTVVGVGRRLGGDCLLYTSDAADE